MDHGHSLLTDGLRKFVGEDGHDRSTADISQKRKAIRRRFRDVLLDCERLLDNPEEAQITRILNAGEDDLTESDVRDLRPGLSSAIGLVWLICNQNDRTTSFTNVAEWGIEQAMRADGYEVAAAVDVTITHQESSNDVRERAQAKDLSELSIREMNVLDYAGDLTDREHERAVEALFDRDDKQEADVGNVAEAVAREKYEQGKPIGLNDMMRLIEAGVLPPDDIPLRRPETDGGDDQ